MIFLKYGMHYAAINIGKELINLFLKWMPDSKVKARENDTDFIGFQRIFIREPVIALDAGTTFVPL